MTAAGDFSAISLGVGRLRSAVRRPAQAGERTLRAASPCGALGRAAAARP